jgi:hypothetical protein
MKWWAILARYAYRGGEFQVRLPLGCRARARAAVKMSNLKGRLERGTAVWGGGSALSMLAVLDAPKDLVVAAHMLVRAPPDLADKEWSAFFRTLSDEMV